MKALRPYTYLATVQGMCRQCRALVPCRIVEQGGAVYQERLCPRCGPARALLADSVAWYLERLRTPVACRPYRGAAGAVQRGCPHDCGPCAAHANNCHLPVFSITNACNMACPICFTFNRSQPQYFMERSELRTLLDRLIERVGPVDLVNLTGGEPTLHPALPDLIAECLRPEIGRVTVNSNGLALAEDEGLCTRLAAGGAYVILSMHTLRPDRATPIYGRDVVAQKLKALENLQRHGIGTTLLVVLIRGLNDDEIGDLIALARRFDVVRSITVQTMTFTGQGGGRFPPRNHLPLDGGAAAIERGTGGQMRAEHFVAHPNAHPLCYSVAYYFKTTEGYRSFTDAFSAQQLRDMLQGGYLLRVDERGQQAFRDVVDRLWAEGRDAALLQQLRVLLDRLYPPGRTLTAFERQRRAEQEILTVYLHAHMDEDTLDLGRLMACPDQVPDSQGRLIPACAYNLFYRMADPRFYQAECREDAR
jgi:7,8-dihydro-6-hydroxymethylpterin dimethyltransferase